MLTTDPIYDKSLQPKIEIKNIASSTTYYTFDAFNDVTTNKVVYCRVDLGIDHHGTFEVQIENSNLGLDITNIRKGQRCIISVKKDSTLSYNILISGLIRKTGYSRGIGGQVLYNISGSSTGIRTNETIIYADITARKLVYDNITLDPTDPNMKADVLLESLLSTTGGGMVSSGLATRSDVENFIPSIKIEFGEAQDAVNFVEDITNAEYFVDTNDTGQFRHQLQPFLTGRGFVLKDTRGTNDDADITGYYDGQPEYSESIYKSDSYSTGIYGILPAEQATQIPNNVGTAGVISSPPNTEYATKFRPTHSHWLPGDLYIVAYYFNNNAATPVQAPKTRFRICTDTGGVPTNVGGVVANIEFNIDAFGSMNETLGVNSTVTISNVQQFFNPSNTTIQSFDLDTTKDYWLILSDDNMLSNRVTFWKTNDALAPLNIKVHTANMSSNTAGGSTWVNQLQNMPMYGMPRLRSQAFSCGDPKAVNTFSTPLTIESTLTNIPSSIKTKEAIQKYMINQMYYMARPQPTYSTFRVSCPNIPILPNDPLMIVDSTLNFSTSGNQAVVATTGAMSYEFGQRGGTGNSISSSLYLNITPVGFATHY
jgi:hypothetical protein